MAYVMHVMDAPHALTPQDAEDFIESEDGKSPAVNPKITEFIQRITALYPDLSEEDVDSDDDNSVWEEGLDDLHRSGQVMQLVVKMDLVDKPLVEQVMKVADSCGLQVLDHDGVALFRAGETVSRRGP